MEYLIHEKSNLATKVLSFYHTCSLLLICVEFKKSLKLNVKVI